LFLFGEESHGITRVCLLQHERPATRRALGYISVVNSPSRRTGRILALDLGKRRIGLAVSDELGITAQGLPTLERTRIRDDLDALAALISEKNVELILMGNPLHMTGREGRQAEYTRDFAARLSERTGVAVTFWDERLTTVQAHRVLRDSGIGIEKRAKAIDRLAATILLESYLDSLGEITPIHGADK
jgi:putative holliday junction resolvase